MSHVSYIAVGSKHVFDGKEWSIRLMLVQICPTYLNSCDVAPNTVPLQPGDCCQVCCYCHPLKIVVVLNHALCLCFKDSIHSSILFCMWFWLISFIPFHLNGQFYILQDSANADSSEWTGLIHMTFVNAKGEEVVRSVPTKGKAEYAAVSSNTVSSYYCQRLPPGKSSCSQLKPYVPNVNSTCECHFHRSISFILCMILCTFWFI